eukprot:c39113_g1_i1.p1 GENE.c39113_g1_i1~~c39113_g1_i1.p1  ORF type:complete len:145 (+),score=28.74 c39113_g1_i1:1-435(+)
MGIIPEVNRSMRLLVACVVLVVAIAHADKRVNCEMTAGVRACINIGQDCVTEDILNEANQRVTRIRFPMREHEVEFPCSKPFKQAPVVIPTVRSTNPGTSKLFAVSLRSVGLDKFSFNAQRVDDVDVPDMSCADLEVCYVAINH